MRALIRLACLALIMLAAGYTLVFTAAQAAAGGAAAPGWRDTGLRLPQDYSNLCLDTGHSEVLLLAESAQGTVAYNWSTGARTVVNTRPFVTCGPAGFLFAADAGRGWRFSLDDPQGHPTDHLPLADFVATDGSLQVYAGAGFAADGAPQLWASADAGRTWELRPLKGAVASYTAIHTARLSPRDARVMYLGFWSPPGSAAVIPGDAGDAVSYGISQDGGQTVTLGAVVHEPLGPAGPGIDLRPALGRFGSIATMLKITSGGASPRAGDTYSISSDGLRTFQDAGTARWTEAGETGLDLVPTPAGLVRLATRSTPLPPTTLTPPSLQVQLTLKRSADGGHHWSLLPAPVPVSMTTVLSTQGNPIHLLGTTEGASILVFRQGTHLYQSQDNGDSWQALPDYSGGNLRLTPYHPAQLLDFRAGGRLFVLDLPAGHAAFVAPVPDSAAPASQYFPQTGHTLDAPFATYWQAHGGLAQLGYPLTDAFHQISPTDGKIYVTQYLERAVFERHPENSPPYDILLSLIGVDAYRARYGTAGAPGQHASTDHPRYFAETGRMLGGRFRQYWEQHGGLAQQGYPISDEFTEVSALDGRPYTVQYFERAVFEAHPENAAPYDVLLSQLGTWRARQLGQPTP